MKKSREFIRLFDAINRVGSERKDGYQKGMLESIPEEERYEAETLVKKAFVHDKDIAVLLPEMKYYDGIELLEKELEKTTNKVLLLCVLYEGTHLNKYADTMYEEIRKNNYLTRDVVLLSRLTPSDYLCDILIELYYRCDNRKGTKCIAEGILFNLGYIRNINTYIFSDSYEKGAVELVRFMTNAEPSMRRKIIDDLKGGNYKDS